MRLATAVLAIAVASSVSTGAQQAPVFRAGVDRVAVDIIAVGRDGMPISDLKAGDLTLKVDGKPREIRSLQLVRLTDETSAPAVLQSALPPAEAVPPPYGSNAPSEAGRAIILVFHHTSLRAGEERSAKEAAAAFIRTLGPRDRVALVTYQEGGVVVDLTTNHARVLKALASISGHAPSASDFIPAQSAAGTASEAAFAVRNLTPLMNSFASIDGPKTVVFVSAGLPGLQRSGGAANVQAMNRAFEYQDLGRAAAKAHVQLYIIQAHSLGGMDASVNHPLASGNGFTSSVQDGLEEFAGVTGGAVFHISAASTQAFERVRLESSAYYLLSFDAESRERDGKHHKISLASGRPGLTLRARPEFLIEKAGSPNAPKSKTETQSLVRDLLTYRDLPLRTVAYSFRAPAGQHTVVVATATDPGATISGASYSLIDEKGHIVGQWDADATDLSSTPVVSATTIAPGDYKLRVSAKAVDGRLGAADYEFRVGLISAGSLTAGGLMLGHMEASKFAPQIDFNDEPSATAYVEVYGKVAPGEKATVTIEIAATADGPALQTIPAAISDTRDDDRWIAMAEIPLDSLKPGDHVVRAVLKVGTSSGTLVRTLRKK
ncbi:MAG TPA: VWA domain-containing protein [Vicinamibacterales bacterium]|nr:VWA domain-containing protein [Vicinamibacterales bacterium]